MCLTLLIVQLMVIHSCLVHSNGDACNFGVTYTLDGVEKTYSQYTSGFAAATTRKLTITVPASAPTLYYWCSLHSGMGGQINTNSTTGSSVLSGSLTNTAFNKSATWSTQDTWPSASYSTVPGYAFAGNYGNPSPGTTEIWYSSGASTVTLTNLADELGTGVTNIKIWVYDRFGDITLTVNDHSITEGNSNKYQEVSINHDGSAITTLTIQGTDSSYWGIGGIMVNGRELVDSTNTSYTGPELSSVERANPTSGFSMVKYTGGLSSAGYQKIAHGLSKAPGMVITKDIGQSTPWIIQHSSLAANEYLTFTSNEASNSSSAGGGYLPKPTDYFFYGSWLSGLNTSGGTCVAYCFAPVEGYSAFGIFSGDSANPGPFQYCGFRPKWFMLKSKSANSRDWIILDAERDPINTAEKYLYPNTAGVEQTYDVVDFFSNGFQMRYAGGLANQTGEEYIWAAFAENPFRVARAR